MMFFGDFETFMKDIGSDRIFAYQVYRRIFTPEEQENKYIDESEYTDVHFQFCRIKEVIPIGAENGGSATDYLLALQDVDPSDKDSDDFEFYTYYRLSELRLHYSPIFEKEECDDENEDELYDE